MFGINLPSQCAHLEERKMKFVDNNDNITCYVLIFYLALILFSYLICLAF